MQIFLDFEKPVAELEAKIEELRHLTDAGELDVAAEVAALQGRVDKILRQAWKNRTKDVLQHPGRLFDDIYIQSIGIIQAPDLLPDGRADMCDSCPDITIYDGKFVNSCRMDEYRLFGGFVSMLEKKEETIAQ